MRFIRLRNRTPFILSIIIVFCLYRFLSFHDSNRSSWTPRHPHSSRYAPPRSQVPISKQRPGVGYTGGRITPSRPKTKGGWTLEPIHYPLPEENLIPIPDPATKPLPQIQADFAPETDKQKRQRLERRKSVRDACIQDWLIYRDEAWGHDELIPVSGGHKDPFGGWGATLVDALDTLWIMGFKDEFEQAVKKVAEIDFTTTPMTTIPVFETTIRYIGGLVAAYDISERKYPVLLEKAVEIADVIHTSFDTMNRMPSLHYYWRPKDRKYPANGGQRAIMSELGSLSVEFTRLAQITGNDTYYDAIARVSDALEGYQFRTTIPGLFPEFVDATGCMRPGDAKKIKAAEKSALKKIAAKVKGRARRFGVYKRSLDDEEDDDYKPGSGMICEARLQQPSGTNYEKYTLGALVDSLYEYLLKEYILLGDVPEAQQYKKMYAASADVIPYTLLFRPKVPGNPDIILPGEHGSGDGSTIRGVSSHLACFAGGMLAMGGKILNRPKDVEYGRKLTDGCVWAYGATKTGIMPETFEVDMCDSLEGECKYNELEWLDGLVPSSWEPPPVPAPDPRKRKKHSQKLTKARRGMARSRARNAAVYEDDDEDFEDDDNAGEMDDEEILYREQTRQEYGRNKANVDNLPGGFVSYIDRRYLLRPEAIESVWYMYRITGDKSWMDKGWEMWKAVNKATQSRKAHSAIRDVSVSADETTPNSRFEDSMESFWFGETLKYFYLLFSEPELLSLDDWVLNTEAHPFKRTDPGSRRA
ncbi:seven-hairpin glycosidase [Ascodesmis nigricans]|uniref:alpha-1,2-Mannosidase n=1 Tax=Ascodesmis nigricans TaxID=341454 RepID=A0A4S2MUH9_9PEZI|nr:seven-hairpin glycosidase [Ascodesmis nigricans]